MSQDLTVALTIKLKESNAKARIAEIGRKLQDLGKDARVPVHDVERLRRRLEGLRDATRIKVARDMLGVRPFRDIQREIDNTRAAYARLASSGRLTATESAQAFLRMQERIVELKHQTNGLKESFEKVKGSAVAFAGQMAVLGLAAKKAISFESALVDVRRAADLSAEETQRIGREFQALARKIGTPSAAIAGLAAEAAKTGVAKQDLVQFSEVVAQAAMNFDMMPEEAGTALAKLKNILRMGVGDMEAFSGAINELADNAAALERDIILALQLGGGSGLSFGLTKEQVAAVATAFINVGATAEQAGTAMRSMFSHIRLAITDTGIAGQALKNLVGDAKDFQRAMERDALGALNKLLSALSRLPAKDRFEYINAIFKGGLDTESITKMVARLDEFVRLQDIAAQGADKFVASLRATTDLKQATTESELNRLAQAWSNLAQAVGTLFLPAIRVLAVALEGLADTLKYITEQFPELAVLAMIASAAAAGAGALRILVAALRLFGVRILGLTKLAGGLTAAFAALGGTAPLLVRLGFAVRALMGPIGWVTTAIWLGVEAWMAWKRSAEQAQQAARKPTQPGVTGEGTGRVRGKVNRMVRGAVVRPEEPEQPTPPPLTTGSDKKAAGATISRLRAALDAELSVIKDGLARQKQALEAALEDKLVSIREYYSRKTSLEQREIDAEIARTQALLAEQRRLAGSGDESQRTSALAEVGRLEAELIVLNNRRADAAVTNARKAAQAERELADTLAELKLKLAEKQGTATDQDRMDALLRQYRAQMAAFKAEGDQAGVDLINRLINVEAAEANLSALEAKWRAAMDRLRNAQELIQIRQNAGLLTETEARRQIVDLQRQSAAELQGMLPAMQDAAGAIGPEAVERMAAYRNEIEQMRLGMDELAPLWADLGQGFGDALNNMLTGATTWRDGLTGLFRQISNSFLQHLVIKPFQEWVAVQARMLAVKTGFAQQEEAMDMAISTKKVGQKMQEAGTVVSANAAEAGSGAANSVANIPYVGPILAVAAMATVFAAVMALMSKVKKFSTGGFVYGPGSSTSDSIPARLSAGEYVVRAEAVRRVGRNFLDNINGLKSGAAWSGGALAFADGGMVPEIEVPAGQSKATTVNNAVNLHVYDDPQRIADAAFNSKQGQDNFFVMLSRDPARVRSVLGI